MYSFKYFFHYSGRANFTRKSDNPGYVERKEYIGTVVKMYGEDWNNKITWKVNNFAGSLVW